jgi:hypothetical protein
MAERIHLAFQEVLEALDAGKTLEEALSAYPQFAEELRPMLDVANVASSADIRPGKNTASRERSRARMLAYAAQMRKHHAVASSPRRQWRFSFAALTISAIILLSSTGIWVASAQSLPGDPLYELKRSAETFNRSLVTKKTSRYDLDIAYRQRRVEEVSRLLELKRIEAVAFEGLLLGQEHGVWQVEDLATIVHADTQLSGPFTLGDEVEVQGITTASGAVLATEIKLRRYHLIGVIEVQEPEVWVIADRRLDISNAIIEDGIGAGSLVEVEVNVSGSGVHQAIFIKRLDLPATPQPGEDTDTIATPTHAATENAKVNRRFEGRLDNMSGSAIIVNGQTIKIGQDTEIEGILSPGVNIRVDAAQQSDGSWIALEIRVEDDGERSDDSEKEPDTDDRSEESDDDEEIDPDEDDLPDEDEPESEEDDSEEDDSKEEDPDDD